MSEPALWEGRTAPKAVEHSVPDGVRLTSLFRIIPSFLLISQTVVSFDLREPSMLHGKKGFDRLVYACQQVLTQPVTWLIINLDESSKIDHLRTS
jgi:hypothetical protein